MANFTRVFLARCSQWSRWLTGTVVWQQPADGYFTGSHYSSEWQL